MNLINKYIFSLMLFIIFTQSIIYLPKNNLVYITQQNEADYPDNISTPIKVNIK
ncbi:hypothetical protein GCM10008934_22430 [Virgibacillus salarius]